MHLHICVYTYASAKSVDGNGLLSTTTTGNTSLDEHGLPSITTTRERCFANKPCHRSPQKHTTTATKSAAKTDLPSITTTASKCVDENDPRSISTTGNKSRVLMARRLLARVTSSVGRLAPRKSDFSAQILRKTCPSESRATFLRPPRAMPERIHSANSAQNLPSRIVTNST